MGLNFTFNIDSIKRKLLKNAYKQVESMLKRVFMDLRLYSPVDSWTYLSGHIYKGVSMQWNKIVWLIENVWEYPERVERWFRSNPVNWNLVNLGQLYNAVGAGTYAKAMAKNKEYFYK